MSLNTRIAAKIAAHYGTKDFILIDDSARHRGHAGIADAAGAETHFKLILVSEAFRGLPRLARQRQVYALLAEEMADGLHALSLDLKAPGE